MLSCNLLCNSNKPMGPEMPHFSTLFSLIKWQWIMQVWQKDRTNTTKPWPRPKGSREPERRNEEAAFSCHLMRKSTGQIHLWCVPMVLSSKGNWLLIILMTREIVFFWLPNKQRGRRRMILAGWRFERLSHRHGKLKSATPQYVHLPTDTDEPWWHTSGRITI